jgi:hypothetical protein
MTKPELKPVTGQAKPKVIRDRGHLSTPAAPDPFDLNKLRLDSRSWKAPASNINESAGTDPQVLFASIK